MSWKIEKLGSLVTESRVPVTEPDPNKRIKVRLNMLGVEKRGVENEIEGATKQFRRSSGQFIYGKQNFHKGAFGIVPKDLDGFETSADIPSFDVREDCLPEWIFYFFKIGNRYLELESLARGVGSKRIHPQQIENIEIPLPSIEEQKECINRIDLLQTKALSIYDELTYQLDLVRKLRQQLLQEAIQGKLVPQNPDDEPASKLLQEIKAEKAKLKKEKVLSTIRPEEIPFQIPNNWTWCRLEEICDSRLGKMLDVGKNKGEFHPYLRNLNVQWYSFNLDDILEMKFESHELDEYSVKKGDLLICEGGYPGRSAIWELENESYKFQKAIHRVRFYDKVSSKFYLYYLDLMCSSGKIEDYFTGSGIQHLTGVSLKKMPIPLPPLAEQNRIVHKLDNLKQTCDELELSIKQSQQQNEQLLQQVLRKALSKPAEIEEPQVKGTLVIADEKYSVLLLAAEIIWQLNQKQTLGHVKLQKLIYLCERTQKMDLPVNFLKKAMGPYDRELQLYLDKELAERQWFGYSEDEPLKYRMLKKAGGHKADFKKHFENQIEAIYHLIKLFEDFTSANIEIIATLFACREEMINNNQLINDTALLSEFYNWSESKTKHKESQVIKGMRWMESNKVLPG